mgnify:CR=1 FL=1
MTPADRPARSLQTPSGPSDVDGPALPPAVLRLIDLALDEDLGRGDVTSEAIFAASDPGRAVMLAKSDLVLSGLDVAIAVFRRVDPRVRIEVLQPDGSHLVPGTEVLRVEGPLGLAARQQRRSVPTVLHVHPKFHSREEAELRIRKARILDVGLRSARGVGGGTEFEQLREYTPDDEFRRVDWAASARAGKPIVRTYRPERNQTVMVLLDNGRLMAAQVDGVPRLEHAMDATIMLTAVASGLGDKIGLVTFDQQVRSIVAPARHGHQVSRVTEAMFELEPVLAESDYQEAFRQTLVRFRRRALLVILTDLAPGAVTDSLIPALPMILRNNLVVIGAVRDPEVAHWSEGVVVDAAQTFRRSAAVAAVDDRERLVARLRGMGATVVDAVPGKLAPALADVYLHVKNTGRL